MAVEHARAWLTERARAGGPETEAGARRLALTLGRALELSMLVRQAQWSLEHERDARAAAAARLFARNGVDLVSDEDSGEDARQLTDDR